MPGESVSLRRNDLHWERDDDGARLPRIHRIVYRVVDDAIAAFTAGQIDLIVGDPARMQEVAGRIGREAFIPHRPGPLGESTFLCFRQAGGGLSPTFARKEFRQAISFALDRDRMIDQVLGGSGRAQWSPISPAQPSFHDPEVRTYAYDPARARAILDRIGVIDRNRDGVRDTPEGKRLFLDLLVTRSAAYTSQIATRISADLERIGIRVSIRQADPRDEDFLRDAIRAGDWDALVHTIPEAYDPQLLSRIWMSSEAMHYWNPSQPEPATPWEGEIDEIFREAERMTDDQSRSVLYRQLQQIAGEQVPLIFTVQRVPWVAVRSRVANFQPTTVGYLHNISRISVSD